MQMLKSSDQIQPQVMEIGVPEEVYESLKQKLFDKESELEIIEEKLSLVNKNNVVLTERLHEVDEECQAQLKKMQEEYEAMVSDLELEL